jgi:hypothetical protein
MVERKTNRHADRKKRCLASSGHTANEGPVRIQYKCLIPIYVFPEMKLCSFVIPRIGLSILLQPSRQSDPRII